MFRGFSPPKWLQSRDYRGPSPRALQCEAEGEQQPLDAFDGGPSVVLISMFLHVSSIPLLVDEEI